MTLLCIRFVAVAFQCEEVFLEKETPPLVAYFCPALDPPLGRFYRNSLTYVRGHEHFIHTKFRKHPLSSSVVKADYVFPYIYRQ